MLIPIIILVLFFITILPVVTCIRLKDQHDHHLYLCARLYCGADSLQYVVHCDVFAMSLSRLSKYPLTSYVRNL
jgi:hypothetical protein